MIHLRPFQPTDAEYAAAVAVDKAVWPELSSTVEEMKHGDASRDKNYFHYRVVAEVEAEKEAKGAKQVVAVAAVYEPAWSYRPGKYSFSIDVHPEWARQGIGTSLYNHLMESVENRDPKPTELSCGSREDKTEGIRFLEKRGFQQTMRWPVSEIDLSHFDASHYTELLTHVQSEGITVQPLSKLQQTDPEWLHKLYDLEWEGTQDEPSPDAPTRLPFKQFVKFYVDAPNFLPEGYFVAVDDGVYVGMSELKMHLSDSTRLDTGFTCVIRSHRRRGLATALKVKGLAFAQQYGARFIRTGNEENNPMYQINLNVGFEPRPGWLHFEKKVAGSEG